MQNIGEHSALIASSNTLGIGQNIGPVRNRSTILSKQSNVNTVNTNNNNDDAYCYSINIPPPLQSKRTTTRMHSSRMRTARSLTVSHCIRKNHARPPPDKTMHTPQIKPGMPPQIKLCMLPPNKTMHAPRIKPRMPPWIKPCMPPLATTHAPPQPCTPRNHARPPLWTEWQTGVKILPCPKLRLRAVKIRVNKSFNTEIVQVSLVLSERDLIAGSSMRLSKWWKERIFFRCGRWELGSKK